MSLVDNRFLCLSGGSAITRYFAEFDSVQQSHGVYANTLVFQAGDTFEFDFLAPTGVVSSSQYFTDGDDVISANRTWFALANTGNYTTASGFTFEVDGVTKVSGDAYPVDGRLHTIKYTFTTDRDIKFLSVRFNASGYYNGILANAVATIGGVTTSNPIGLATGNVEASITTGPANALTYVFIPEAQREQYTPTNPLLWTNISPEPQELPAVIEIAS